MKSLLLMRHAKSSWDDHRLRDHDRPLNPRGERAAPRMGQLIVEEEVVPERILCSTAVRARQTADLVAAACAFDGEAQHFDELYMASPQAIVDVVARKSGDAGTVLVVAHNPGMEALVAALTGQSESFPTAALALVRPTIEAWSDLAFGADYELAGFWRPREL